MPATAGCAGGAGSGDINVQTCGGKGESFAKETLNRTEAAALLLDVGNSKVEGQEVGPVNKHLTNTEKRLLRSFQRRWILNFSIFQLTRTCYWPRFMTKSLRLQLCVLSNLPGENVSKLKPWSVALCILVDSPMPIFPSERISNSRSYSMMVHKLTSVESIVITQIPIWFLFREFPSLFDIYSARCYNP
jgi:hypothetical protein